MSTIRTLDDLNAAKEEAIKQNQRLGNDIKERILICTGGGCIASGALKIRDALAEALEKNGLTDSVAIVETGCLGPCAGGPVLVMGSDKTFYQHVSENDVDEIITSHIKNGTIVERLTWKQGTEKTPVPVMTDIEFFKRQTKIVLRNSGTIDPTCINDYIGKNGYQAIAKALLEMKPEEVIEEVHESGIRGRGGAGFPTALKWGFTRKSENDQKYILCNADEGDPGAFMDRSVLEGDPHSLIEGMMIGGFAIGATQGFIYVRAEYPLAVERLQKALDDARSLGLLGENIFGTDFSFDLEIRMGSGAFVCGEETALINSIEGKRGEPRPRPPFPAHKGLWQKPSSLNNVETFANIPEIIRNGGPWYSAMGTPTSTGTKVFALAGAIVNAGLVEVPVGTSLRELIFAIGGGIPGGKEYKAAQIGGPSGGCIPKQHLDVHLDYDSLTKLGAIMGSGGLIVMDESACMVDVARFFLEFTQEESCGKCVPCREGTKRMLTILERICAGKGKEGDIELLTELAHNIKNASLCGLGQTAPNPVLSTLMHFREEYEEHIYEKKCRAHVCAAHKRYEITDTCIGCGACRRACPAEAITGDKKVKHVILQDKCIKCGQCKTVCKFNAVIIV